MTASSSSRSPATELPRRRHQHPHRGPASSGSAPGTTSPPTRPRTGSTSSTTSSRPTSEVFLGLTLRYGHCHDHKFEPLTSLDYTRVVAALRPAPTPPQRSDGAHDEHSERSRARPWPKKDREIGTLRLAVNALHARVANGDADAPGEIRRRERLNPGPSASERPGSHHSRRRISPGASASPLATRAWRASTASRRVPISRSLFGDGLAQLGSQSPPAAPSDLCGGVGAGRRRRPPECSRGLSEARTCDRGSGHIRA